MVGKFNDHGRLVDEDDECSPEVTALMALLRTARLDVEAADNQRHRYTNNEGLVLELQMILTGSEIAELHVTIQADSDIDLSDQDLFCIAEPLLYPRSDKDFDDLEGDGMQLARLNCQRDIGAITWQASFELPEQWSAFQLRLAGDLTLSRMNGVDWYVVNPLPPEANLEPRNNFFSDN